MPTSGPAVPPAVVRRVDSASASALAELAALFEDMQTVLRCCERLVSELGGSGGEPDDVSVEAMWTTALLSYARCFAASETGSALTEEDLKATHDSAEVVEWHRVLLQLRDHYADVRTNPRETFSVGVAQDVGGAADGIAITSARQPLVDDLTVRQTGAIAFTLSGLVNDRITAQQEKVFGELSATPKADLDKLDPIDVAQPDSQPDQQPDSN